jgi:hypothetical protein
LIRCRESRKADNQAGTGNCSDSIDFPADSNASSIWAKTMVRH